MEEFRQQVVDRTVLSMVNRGVVKTSDFEIKDDYCMISDKMRRLFISKILDRLDSKVKVDGKYVTWDRLINNQALLLAKYLTGETNYKGFYRRW